MQEIAEWSSNLYVHYIHPLQLNDNNVFLRDGAKTLPRVISWESLRLSQTDNSQCTAELEIFDPCPQSNVLSILAGA